MVALAWDLNDPVFKIVVVKAENKIAATHFLTSM